MADCRLKGQVFLKKATVEKVACLPVFVCTGSFVIDLLTAFLTVFLLSLFLFSSFFSHPAAVF